MAGDRCGGRLTKVACCSRGCAGERTRVKRLPQCFLGNPANNVLMPQCRRTRFAKHCGGAAGLVSVGEVAENHEGGHRRSVYMGVLRTLWLFPLSTPLWSPLPGRTVGGNEFPPHTPLLWLEFVCDWVACLAFAEVLRLFSSRLLLVLSEEHCNHLAPIVPPGCAHLLSSPWGPRGGCLQPPPSRSAPRPPSPYP